MAIERTIGQLAERLDVPETTVRQALQRARDAGTPAPGPIGHVANADTYDSNEFAVWWWSRPGRGRPYTDPTDPAGEGEGSYRASDAQQAVARMLADWVTEDQGDQQGTDQGAEASVQRRAESGSLPEFARLIEHIAGRRPDVDPVAVAEVLADLRGADQRAAWMTHKWVVQGFWRIRQPDPYASPAQQNPRP